MAEEITFEEFALKLLEALNNCEVDYLVVGGVAAVFYGRPRLTSAKAIIHAQKGLDRKYLERRANEEKVGKKLDELYKFFGQQ